MIRHFRQLLDKNPWRQLDVGSGHLVHPIDRSAFEDFNVRHAAKGPKFQLREDSIPEPFVGNLATAKVVILLLNPGHVDIDLEWQRHPEYRKLHLANLRQDESADLTFYPLAPQFSGAASHQWWKRRFASLIEDGVTIESLSRSVAMLEWVPYHSVAYAGGSQPSFPTQNFTIEMVETLSRDVHRKFVIFRAKKVWNRYLSQTCKPLMVSNPRNPTLSRANIGNQEYAQILGLLRA